MNGSLDQEDQERKRADERKRVQILQMQEMADLEWLMGNKRGRRIVARMLKEDGAFGTVASSFNTNAMQMAFTEGKRARALLIMSKVQVACPEHWLSMIKENKE